MKNKVIFIKMEIKSHLKICSWKKEYEFKPTKIAKYTLLKLRKYNEKVN